MNGTTLRRLFLLGLFAAFVLDLPCEAQRKRRGKNKGDVKIQYYTGTLDEARKEAEERNVAVVIHAMLDEEEDNERYRVEVLPNKQMRQATKDLIVICANNGVHETKQITEVVEGEKVTREVCASFETDSCSAHQKTWDAIYRQFREEETGDLHLPLLVLMKPDWSLAWQTPEKGTVPSVSDATRVLKKIRKDFGRSLTLRELNKVKKDLDWGETFTRAGALGDAHRALSGAAQVATDGLYGKKVREQLAVTEKKMTEALAEVKGRLVPGKVARAWRDLLGLAEEWKGTAFEKQVLDTLKAAGRDKSIQDEVKAVKLELEAEELWLEAQEHARKKQDRKAERAVLRLLKKKYAGTAAQASAREAYPELARKVDEKGA